MQTSTPAALVADIQEKCQAPAQAFLSSQCPYHNYACLAGISIDQIVKQAGIKFGTKFTTAMIKKIPGTVLTKINQKVGFRFLTKFGEKGIINIAKLVPVVGGVIGGGFDLAETKTIANRAYKMFIKEDFSILNDKNTNDAEEIIDVDTDTIEPTE